MLIKKEISLFNENDETNNKPKLNQAIHTIYHIIILIVVRDDNIMRLDMNNAFVI